MSSQEFISDMKKLFAVCAISNFGAKICRFGFMDDFSNCVFGRHISLLLDATSLCAQSAQMLASAFQLDVFSF